MSNHLKPCPFCGSDSITNHDILIGYSVGCDRCGAVSARCSTETESISAWNTRTAIQQADAKTDEPFAWVEHHKGGDNLVWDEPGGRKSPLYTNPATGVPDALKDHQIADMVNSLRDIALQFHGHGSLRERIANVLVPALKAEAKPDVRCEGCGYMTHHREHMGCVRAAIQQADAKTDEPVAWGWAIVDNKGLERRTRARIQDFFGSTQEAKPFSLEDVAREDREFAGCAPHRVITLFTHPAPGVPDGYALVPIEPTKEMLEAGDAEDHWHTELIYAAMLAASPTTQPKEPS